MSQRRAMQCPKCGEAIGTLIDGVIRCEHKVMRWEGDAKRGFTPITAQGCGGKLGMCVHGLRHCEGRPPCQTFEDATEPLPDYVPLAELTAAEKVEAQLAKAALKEAERKALGAPVFSKNAGQMLAGPAPKGYTPPKARKNEKRK